MAVEDAVEVDVDDPPPAVERIGADRLQRPADAGVVDEKVERGGPLLGGGDHPLHRRRVGHVAGMGEGGAADLLRNRLGMARIEVVHHDGGARSRQFAGDGGADPRSGAGDDGGPAVEADVHDASSWLRFPGG